MIVLDLLSMIFVSAASAFLLLWTFWSWTTVIYQTLRAIVNRPRDKVRKAVRHN